MWLVIGGGNTAVDEALYLTNHRDVVTLIHRRESLRDEKILQDRLFANPKIKLLWNKTVDRFVAGDGTAGLVGVDLIDTVTGETSHEPTAGGFVAIGPSPSNEMFQVQLPRDAAGSLEVPPGPSLTHPPRVFPAGH